MRWRNSAIYLLVLLLIGGYYYYFEVVKKAEKEAAEKLARRAFVFDAGSVGAIEIRAGEAKPVLLNKEERWKIAQPLDSEIDKTAFDGFFSALQNIEQERKLGQASQNLEAFGLTKPSLLIRVQAGDQWLELQVGEKNPAENARYARAGAEGDVFLIPRGNYEAVNKSLKDLRKKELFSWQPEEVVSMEVTWQSGEALGFERQAGSREWKAAGLPDLKIKAKKVDDVINQVHWLRAVDFLDQGAMPATPMVELKLKLKDGRTSNLKIADPDPENKQAAALSSGMESPVRIATHILTIIPKSADLFEDRSLVDFPAADVRQVAWKTEAGGGEVVWLGEDKWGAKGSANPKPLEEPWPISGFLADIEHLEFIEVIEHEARAPEGTPNFVQFLSVDGKKESLAWDTIPTEVGQPVTAWLEKSGSTQKVRLQFETARNISDSLSEITGFVQGGKQE
ncbi:MAG: DUF4340 domain-containing protein [Syntrophobacteraceae bacterium]